MDKKTLTPEQVDAQLKAHAIEVAIDVLREGKSPISSDFFLMRKALNWRREDLADFFGVTITTVVGWETHFVVPTGVAIGTAHSLIEMNKVA